MREFGTSDHAPVVVTFDGVLAMSLRLRLIVAFLLLSVVPLGAVTIYSYTSNAKRAADAATRETDQLAGELSQRMQLVTAQLSERVEHLMESAGMRVDSGRAPDAREARAGEARGRGGADRATATDAPPRRPPNIDPVYERRSRRRSARRPCCSTPSSARIAPRRSGRGPDGRRAGAGRVRAGPDQARRPAARR